MIDCPRCVTGKMVASSERGVLCKCINCSHEIVDFNEAAARLNIRELDAKQKEVERGRGRPRKVQAKYD